MSTCNPYISGSRFWFALKVKIEEMQDDEEVLSDVHVAVNSHYVESSNYSVSRFWFTFDPLEEQVDSNSHKADLPRHTGCTDTPANHVDTDGDLILRRPPHQDCMENDSNIVTENRYVLTIAHFMSTKLVDVGKQVWCGSLLLTDYLIYIRKDLEDKTVVDLGAGTGITSIVAAFFAKKIFCTDIGHEVLKLAEHNLDQNWDCIGHNDSQNYTVKQLDWFSEDFKSECGRYSLTKEDVDTVMSADYIIAGEVIYDDDLTAAFFRTVYKLMSHKPAKTLYVTMEKRYIFTIEDKDAVAPAYEFFCECIHDLINYGQRIGVQFHCEEIPIQFPQFFMYQRTKELDNSYFSTSHLQRDMIHQEENLT